MRKLDFCSNVHTRELNTIEQKSTFFAIIVSMWPVRLKQLETKMGVFADFCSIARVRERNRAEQTPTFFRRMQWFFKDHDWTLSQPEAIICWKLTIRNSRWRDLRDMRDLIAFGAFGMIGKVVAASHAKIKQSKSFE